MDERAGGTAWVDTEDAAHGGANVVFGIMNMRDDTCITVHDTGYSPW